MEPDFKSDIPVGVSLTHDKGHPIFFAYVGSSRGRLGMRAKRFNPRKLGSMERALKQAVRWRKQALKDYTAALAALGAPTPRGSAPRRKPPVAARRKPQAAPRRA